MLRQKEVADATSTLAGVNNSQARQSQARQNENVQAISTFSGQALQAQGKKEDLDTQIRTGNHDRRDKYIGAGLKGLSAISGSFV